MIKSTLFVGCLIFLNNAYSQLSIQSGATFSIDPAAKVIVQGSLSNTSGTLTNNGVLEVRGDFLNNGTYGSASNTDSLLLTGTSAAILNTGSSSLNYLQVNKTGGVGVTLGADVTVNNKFEMLAGTLSTDLTNGYQFISPFSANFSYAAGTEIIGRVTRSSWANGTGVIFNNTNMVVTTNGGTPPTMMMVKMVPGGDPTGSEREVTRSFVFTPTGGTGYSADLQFPFKTTELNSNTEANLTPWYIASHEWNAKLTGNTVNTTSHFVSTTAIPATTFAAAEWKLADPIYTFNVNAILRGSWNGTAMTTLLNSGGKLPLSQPYSVTPFSYHGTETVSAIPNNKVVDWVLLELRKPASGLAPDATSSTVIGRQAAFLLNNGTIVNLDGVTPATLTIKKQGPSFVVVRHRNHLAVMSNLIPSNAAGTFANDFTALANNYKKTSSSSDPVILLSGGVKYGLWGGDANRSGSINATDLSAIILAVSNSANGYLTTDVNLSNSINGTDISLTTLALSLSATGSTAGRAVTTNNNSKTITTNVPD